MQPGEVQSIVIKVGCKIPKLAEAWLSGGDLTSVNMDAAFGELERFFHGLSSTPLLLVAVSFNHAAVPSDTTCASMGTCYVKRMITTPGSKCVKRSAALLNSPQRTTVHQRLALYYFSTMTTEGATSALEKVMSTCGGQLACPEYMGLLSREEQYQIRLERRRSESEPRDESKVLSNQKENVLPSQVSATQLENVRRSLKPRTTANPRPSRSAEDIGSSDAARRIWNDIRLKSKPSNSPQLIRTPSAKLQDNLASMLRETALRNKRSIGADTLRSLSSSSKGLDMSVPWM